MDTLKKIFPFAFKATEKTAYFLVLLICAAGYALVGSIFATLGGAFESAILSLLFNLLGAAADVYALVAIILTTLVFWDVSKKEEK